MNASAYAVLSAIFLRLMLLIRRARQVETWQFVVRHSLVFFTRESLGKQGYRLDLPIFTVVV